MSRTTLRLTPQRRAVLDVLRECDDHPTAADVLTRVRRRHPGIGAATVYRSLALLGDVTFPMIQRYVDDIVSVSEAAIAAAMGVALVTGRLWLEPAGAVALAAALAFTEKTKAGKPLIAIGSGGNVALARMVELAGFSDTGRIQGESENFAGRAGGGA